MTLASGQLPYNYDHGKGRFRVPNPYSSIHPIGPSGVLLEQALFVLTAERRKLLKFSFGEGNNYLYDAFVYVNPVIAPSGPYEPKANGSTIGNAVYPGAAFIIDHIQDLRYAMNQHFSFISQDTNLGSDDYRAAWLQALYPESPSGFLFATDPDTGNDVTGHWAHRAPSDIGAFVDYTLPEVLGASGILYDIDFGELMWNPPPHLSSFGNDTMHSRKVDGTNDTFSVQQFPIFPAFQKTNGDLVTLTGREPDVIPQASDYQIDHIASGAIRFDGYALFSNTKLFVGRNGNIFNTTTPDFTVDAEGHRVVLDGGNVASSRIFASPSAQTSGVYRIAAKNRFADFPTTTIESGKMSFWPTITSYWPNSDAVVQPYGQTQVVGYLGYHVFDDCLWQTDVSFNQSVTPDTGFCSGLAIMSPYTGHPLWVRYADQTAVDSIPLAGFPAKKKNWSTGKGLERVTTNDIRRLHPNIQHDATLVSGQFIIMQYNDMLDLTTSFATTSDSVETGLVDNVPLGVGSSTTIEVNDLWRDDVTGEYWIANSNFAGFDVWKFDSSFKYINKYIFNPNSGINNARGFFMNGNHYLFHGEFGATGTTHIRGSGIYPVRFGADGTEPYDNTSNQPQVGVLWIWPNEGKFINGAPFLGTRRFAEILDMIYVPSATHVVPGVYALVRWARAEGSFNDLYLLRLEETTDAWEIRAVTELDTSFLSPNQGRRELLYMTY
jgi:hypothetical protein